ncbi:MAG: hypothetical protein NW241_14940 [Bacteroidia bacterium]|nr:hypothetical protein [Bacteroidia bacterium]
MKSANFRSVLLPVLLLSAGMPGCKLLNPDSQAENCYACAQHSRETGAQLRSEEVCGDTAAEIWQTEHTTPERYAVCSR